MTNSNLITKRKKNGARDVLSWVDMEKRSRQYIDKFQDIRYANIKFKKPAWYCLCFISDMHLGNEGVDYEQARIDAQSIGKNKYAYAVLGGDYIDNFISAKILEPLIQATTNPSQQLQLFEQYLMFFKQQIMLMVSGNHDDRSKHVTGLDILKTIAKQDNIIYSPHEFNFTLTNGKGQYKVCVRHKGKFNSIYNATHSVKQYRRLGQHIFDIGAIGHNHNAALEDCYVQGEHFISVRMGSYKVCDSFSVSLGYPDAKPIFPCVIISPEEKKMVSMKHLDEALDFVNYKNGKKRKK